MIKKEKNFKNIFYTKFLGILIKTGKKAKAKKILDMVLSKVSKKTKLTTNFVLYRVFFNLNTFVEIRRIRSRRRSYLVPFNIKFSRRIFLILKWVLLAVKADVRKISIIDKLALEIYKIVNNLSCTSLKLKELNNAQAFSNKANIHFRW